MTADDNRFPGSDLVNTITVLCLVVPFIGITLCGLSGNPWWLLLLAPGIIWQEGFVALVLIAMFVLP